MKTIGIIGGMSYESSLHYYERINRQVNEICGDLTCARLLIYNVNFQEIRSRMLDGKWDEIGDILSKVAKTLESAGADYIVIATNTIHKVAEHVQESISIPLIHIADTVSEKIHKNGIKKVGLIGTKYTMTEDFLRNRIKSNGIDAVVPKEKYEIDEIDRIIFDELCKGEIKDTSKEYYISVINKMIEEEGIEGVILGCTEIEMLLIDGDVSVPLFDTTQAHIDAIVDYALEKR